MKMIFVGIIVPLFILAGCASMKESVITGVGVGAASGAATGSMASPANRKKGALTGALIGAAIGGISSYFIHDGLKKRDGQVRRETLFNLDKFNVSSPRGVSTGGQHGLTMPVVESQWIDTQVKGKQLVEGHRIWLITEDPQWVPGKKLKKKEKR